MEESKEEIWDKINLNINNSILSGNQGTEIEIIQRFISDVNEGVSGYKLVSKDKRYILRRLNERLNKAIGEQKNKEMDKINAEKAIKQIEDIVEREYRKGNVKNKVDYWRSIKDTIKDKDEYSMFNIKIGKSAQDQLLEMIEERINTEKDLLYYDQVKRFTRDFSFLMEYSEVAIAKGIKTIKFTDKESYERFVALRLLLKTGLNEYNQIDKLLVSNKVDDASKRILATRKSVMDKQIETINQEELR